MKNLVQQYLDYHRSAWAASTMKSESARLITLAAVLDNGPQAVFDHLNEKGSTLYTIKTTLIRVAGLETWAIEQGLLSGPGSFSCFLKKHRNKLKHAYQRKDVNVSQDEVSQRLAQLPSDVRPQAEFMLKTGVRISEVYGVQQDSQGLFVVGKGGKPRRLYGKIELPQLVSKARLCRELAVVGLKPHDLRKIAATRIAASGATAQDLCKLFGWSNIHTAYYYLQSRHDKGLDELVEKASRG